LRVQVLPHVRFERQGDDLTTHVEVPLTTAVLGGEAVVTTLAGSTVRLKVPPTTQNGQKFRVKGQGMPVPGKPDERGDLYVVADVEQLRNKRPKAYGATHAGFSSRLRGILQKAEGELARFKDEFVSTEHLLLALVSESGRSPAAEVLTRHGVTYDRVLDALVA